MLRRLVQIQGWFWAFLIALLLCVIIYGLNAFLSETRPFTAWGIGYGVAAAVFMFGAAVWAIRRRTMSLAPGRSQHWVQFHVYGGALALVLMLMHVGFRLPSGHLAWWLYLLTIWVSLSGLFGVFLQKTIPRILASGLSIEVHYNRIPELIQDLKQRAEELVQTSPDAMRDFYHKELAPMMAKPESKAIYYLDITGGIQSRMKQFDYLRRFLSTEEKEKLNQLQSMYEAKLEMDAHYTLQRSLRLWLFFHVPVSIVLLILVGFHLFAVLYY